jgi:hypothetical protein
MTQNYYIEEKEKIRRFRWDMLDEVDKAAWRAMDAVEKIIKDIIMPQIKEAIKSETAALKAFVANAPFNDPYLKEDLYKSLDGLPDTAEMFIIAGIRRTVRKAFEVLKDDVNEKTTEALEGLDLLIIPANR